MPPAGLSVVIPSYQRPERLRQCLEALARLDYPSDLYEVIVVDDGSNPALEWWPDETTKDLDYTVIRQENQGPAAARNKGVSVAKFPWIAFTDDDCHPRPDWLKEMAAALALAPHALVGGHTVNDLKDNPFAQASQDLIDFLYGYYNEEAGNARLITSNNMAVDRKTFQDLGGFNSAMTRAGGEDRELCDHWRSEGFPCFYVSTAIVDHTHDMGFLGFLKQHFNYGCAAPIYHELRVQRGQKEHRGRTPEPPSFYAKLLTYPLRNGQWVRWRGWRSACLMLLSQMAYAGGVLAESVRPRRR